MSIRDTIASFVRSIFGRRMTIVELTAALAKKAQSAGEPLDWKMSVVDLMKLVGMDSSRANRIAMAKELGYPHEPDASAAMNTWLHQKIIEKLARDRISP